MSLTEAQYKAFLSKSIDYKQSKYKNKKVTAKFLTVTPIKMPHRD